ncbi:MAG: endonuclease III domain-containing protein [Candidatus Omnitrophica bacterium]|nr:endonuclease III domain-containing protein [Candidatus Omnitrophota bacterium]
MKKRLAAIYDKLYAHFGPQGWWPASSAFEVIVGAILTQNTSWVNVEKAVANLKKDKALNPRRLLNMNNKRLAGFLRPAGYYNIKTKRLKEFLKFFCQEYRGNIARMSAKKTQDLRLQLLKVHGVGQETADSILLYALNKPVFVVDAYTRRILSRHGLVRPDMEYAEIQNLFRKNLKNSVKLFNEYHALLVKLGKDYCRKNNPKCQVCPLK